MIATRITERREFEHMDGAEEVRVCVHEKDRIEVSDEACNWQLVIQDDGQGHVEIEVLEGRVRLYT